MIELVSLVFAGFSAISALLLLGAWLTRLDFPVHTPFSIVVTSALMLILATLALEHLRWLTGGAPPLEALHYRVGLFLAPALFYLFCRSAVTPEAPLHPGLALHLAPVILALVAPVALGLPILLTIGAGYSLWFARLLWTLRGERRRAHLQLAFFVISSVLALAVLVLGFALPWIDPAFFYLTYNAAMGLTFAFVIGAVIAIPDLFRDVSDIVRVRSGHSSLGRLDVDDLLARLERLMSEEHLYRDETLGLGTLAGALELSSHQLSELLNRHLGTSFSRYLRERRIAAAQRLLVEQPRASVLAIGLETGFRSQSTFYSAFKEITGQSPGDWRKQQDP